MLLRVGIRKIRVPRVSQQSCERIFGRALLPGSQGLAEIVLVVLVWEDAAGPAGVVGCEVGHALGGLGVAALGPVIVQIVLRRVVSIVLIKIGA